MIVCRNNEGDHLSLVALLPSELFGLGMSLTSDTTVTREVANVKFFDVPLQADRQLVTEWVLVATSRPEMISAKGSFSAMSLLPGNAAMVDLPSGMRPGSTLVSEKRNRQVDIQPAQHS